MVSYPKVGRKLPELFEAIIQHQNEMSEFLNSITSDVIPFKAAQNWRELKNRNFDLIKAADQYIKDARGASNT